MTAPSQPKTTSGQPRSTFAITGMTCAHCARRVTDALQGIDGVSQANVELEKGRATVNWKPDAAPDENAILSAVEQAGYRIQPLRATSEFSIQGMTCANCARTVTEAIQNLPGVTSAAVNLTTGQATVRWENLEAIPAGAVSQAVAKAGYEAVPLEATGDSCHAPLPGWSPLAGWKFNVVFGSIITALLMLGEWGLRLGMERWFQWAAFALALPVQILCGARFYRGAWRQLQAGNSNMDTLVALGSTTAFAYSLWALFSGWHTHVYFMEAAAIITLISVGHWLESITSAKAAGSLRALLNLAPQTARKFEHGQETEVPVSSLREGDEVILKPGDRIPTDGDVVDGASAVDESMLTGESVPIDKAPGAKLYTGTVNLNGRLRMRVTATGESTALAQIIAVVQRAQNSRANIQKLGDRVSSVFVPIVVFIALAAGLWWGLAPESATQASRWLGQYLWPVTLPETALAMAMIHAAAVLIIACPCAMGLATPAAIMAGTNAAARRGILIRDAQALERSGRITAVVFDKTGTLTYGKVSVAAVEKVRGTPAAFSLQKTAAALASPSTHPLSQAVASLESDHAASLENWSEVRGSGVQAQWAGDGELESGSWLRLGSLNWLRENRVELAEAAPFESQWAEQGATILGLAADERLIGLLALRDSVKDQSAEVIARLTRAGNSVFLITGDNRATAQAIARHVGIPAENVFAEIRPEKKAEIVKELQARGERVAFVGDGINDAPALEQSDLGIAVARASDVAREAADIILLKSDIQAIPEALGLAQATLRNIKQNLFWAFFYNSAAIPLAAFGFLSPVLCAAAMGMSDLVVLGNALRLRYWKA